MPLVLGPVLRHVDETTASVWVQTERATTVSVLGCSARTFEVAGHHYALVPVSGLEPGGRTPYDVTVDGERVWPPATSPFPPSMICTRRSGADERHRIVFGSCRYAKVSDPALTAQLGVDALDAYAARMASRPVEEWPDALLLLGDQVYADELTPRTRRRIATRTDRHSDWPDDEIVGFDEYAGLYRDSWRDPEVRWLMSTVPTAMIFDDHDVRDDWNTSAAWRREMQTTPWWRERIRSAIASYWVYQHLGNLPSDDLATDPDYRKIVEHDGDTWPLLVDLADRADAEADGKKGVRFSYRWDLGNSRLLMIDSRNGRILEDGEHLMLAETEFSWIEEQAAAPGRVEHLVIGTSIPWLLPHAISHLETVNEIAAARPGWRGRLGETLR
ncbi:MAG: alkaline phosphatase D family protein, partial [Pseudonocardia sp.]